MQNPHWWSGRQESLETHLFVILVIGIELKWVIVKEVQKTLA